jgi:hypothetical protein
MKLNIINLIIFIILIIIFIWIKNILHHEHFTDSDELINSKNEVSFIINKLHIKYVVAFDNLANFIKQHLENSEDYNYKMTIAASNTLISGNLDVDNILNVSGDIDIDHINLKTLIINTIYPVGSYYTQYSSVDLPEKMFGGIWEMQWDNKGVFFRTEGDLSNESRSNDGTQDYALRKIYGTTPFYQMNLWDLKPENKSLVDSQDYGVMPPNEKKNISTESGGSGTFKGGYMNFNSANGSNTSQYENTVKNRLFVIWKKISN